MELLLVILENLSAIKFAILAIPERHLYIAAFFTPMLVFGVFFLKEILTYNRLNNEKL